jgi:DNA polymerase III subunit delta
VIELLSGENAFELARALKKRQRAFDGVVERYEGGELTSERMADLVAGQTLFSDKRLIIIDTPSANTELWQHLATWLERAADTTHIVLVEAKPDKRTATYKWLKKNVRTEEFPAWTERDAGAAEEWLRFEAKAMGISLTHQVARLLITRIGFDQWQLFHALQKVALLEEINETTVRAITNARPDENVFELLDTALRGDASRLAEMMRQLSQTEEPYRVFGLLSGQVVQLAALALGSRTGRDVAGDLGASPFMVNKLSIHAARLSTAQVRKMLKVVAHADARLKSTPADPWMLIEHMLSNLSRV